MLAGKVNSEKMYNLRILWVNIEIDVFVYYILLGVELRKFTITYIKMLYRILIARVFNIRIFFNLIF